MSLTEAFLTEAGGMRGLEAASNRVYENYGVTPSVVPEIVQMNIKGVEAYWGESFTLAGTTVGNSVMISVMVSSNGAPVAVPPTPSGFTLVSSSGTFWPDARCWLFVRDNIPGGDILYSTGFPPTTGGNINIAMVEVTGGTYASGAVEGYQPNAAPTMTAPAVAPASGGLIVAFLHDGANATTITINPPSPSTQVECTKFDTAWATAEMGPSESLTVAGTNLGGNGSSGIGYVIWASPPSPTFFTDNFNRADGPVGSNWAGWYGQVPQIVSNHVEGPSGGGECRFWSTIPCTTNKQFAQAKHHVPSGQTLGGLSLCGDYTTNTTGYEFRRNSFGGQFDFVRNDSWQGSWAGSVDASDDVWRMESVANASNAAHLDVIVKRNGVEIFRFTDTAPLTGRYCGARVDYQGGGTYMDDWTHGDMP